MRRFYFILISVICFKTFTTELFFVQEQRKKQITTNQKTKTLEIRVVNERPYSKTRLKKPPYVWMCEFPFMYNYNSLIVTLIRFAHSYALVSASLSSFVTTGITKLKVSLQPWASDLRVVFYCKF